MGSSAKRQVNPVIELAGAQWLVSHWRALAEDAVLPEALVIYRLTPKEQKLLMETSVDWEVWEEVYRCIKRRPLMPMVGPILPEDDPDGDF